MISQWLTLPNQGIPVPVLFIHFYLAHSKTTPQTELPAPGWQTKRLASRKFFMSLSGRIFCGCHHTSTTLSGGHQRRLEKRHTYLLRMRRRILCPEYRGPEQGPCISNVSRQPYIYYGGNYSGTKRKANILGVEIFRKSTRCCIIFFFPLSAKGRLFRQTVYGTVTRCCFFGIDASDLPVFSHKTRVVKERLVTQNGHRASIYNLLSVSAHRKSNTAEHVC